MLEIARSIDPVVDWQQGDTEALPRQRALSSLLVSASARGIGHVTPHQLCHTLATQAINRAMSLDAIAALLGHKTLAMTMAHTRIADRPDGGQRVLRSNRES
jgi:integrase